MPSAEAGAEARRYGRSATLLSAGIGAGGVLTYLFFALASHNLTRVDYGQIVVLWSAAVMTVSIVDRPVEQLLSRTVAERQARGLEIGHALRVAALIQLGIAVAVAVALLALRTPITDDLFGGNETLYWVLLVAVVAYGASFYARGFLAGSRRFGLLAGLMVSEALGRFLFALAVAIGVASGQDAVALGIVAAPLLSLIVVPLAFVGRSRRAASEPESAQAPTPEGADFTLASGGGFAAAVFVVMLSEQALLNGGPLLVRASAGAAAAGYIFNVLLVARAPLLLFQGIATSLLPHLTRLRSRGTEGAEAFRLSIRGTMKAIAAFTAAVCAVMLVAGPALMQLAFGEKFSYDRVGLLCVSVGMGLYLAATTLSQAAVAQGQVRRAGVRWAACAVGFLAFNLLPVLSEFRRVEVGFLAAAAVLCGLLYLLYRRPIERPLDAVAPGSSAEVEARLAAAEEAT
jgi:O-antigen/teichoic acid export membrane protein